MTLFIITYSSLIINNFTTKKQLHILFYLDDHIPSPLREIAIAVAIEAETETATTEAL